MSAFDNAYVRLNDAQKQAVDTIDGPVLVIAGPGTGKTQLLGARVANILRRTDTPAQNILCLTFTESGAANMRERLTRFIGQAAYEVNIGTYHAFGSDLISQYPQYFWDTRLENPIDDLAKRELLLSITESLSFKNPLRQTRHHIGDLMSTISEVKRALLTSDDLRRIARENQHFTAAANRVLAEILADFKRMPSRLDKAAPYFEALLTQLAAIASPSGSTRVPYATLEPLGALCVRELLAAYEQAATESSTKPLTAWKNAWLAKDTGNNFVIAGELETRRIDALADVLENYQAAMAAQGLYDFDDMILRSIAALEQHTDLRYSLQERYLYILLDEFQDTNAAQLQLIQLLTDNPTNEGRPNILAVGDDDQAIYAFQGAQYSNMLEFYDSYKDTVVINLSENYRSHQAILHTASNIVSQINERLISNFDAMTKTLNAGNTAIMSSQIERRDFVSDISERAWVAAQIKRLIDNGTPPHEIAILAPKHKHLEPFVSYLNALNIPVRYEKRENILDAPVIKELIAMCRLVRAIANGDHDQAASLWPMVLSFDFWHIPTADIWHASWQVNDSRLGAQPTTWDHVLLDTAHPAMRCAADVLFATATKVDTVVLENILDYLIGSTELGTHLSSPLRDYYTSKPMQEQSPELFYETLSHLKVLRSRLRDYQSQSDKALKLDDFLRFVDLYQEAGQPVINTSPYAQSADAVQLMTVFKAKGLEYTHVFLPSCHDQAWGSGSRGNTNKLTLPPNLYPIRHAGATDDERLRLFFVAITRAKQGLYLTSARNDYVGKSIPRLKYLNEQEQPDGSYYALALPSATQIITQDTSTAPTSELLTLDWRTKHIDGLASVSLTTLLTDRLAGYQITASDILSYIDIEYAGPKRFFFDRLLGFPSAPTVDSQFGTAIHETLEWYQHQTDAAGVPPGIPAALARFDERLAAKRLISSAMDHEIERGHAALSAYFSERGSIFTPGAAIVERSFRREGVLVGDAHLAGRIDRMEIDTTTKTITVVDYKTGKSFTSWRADSKLHKNEIQLYIYKILVENSKTYRGYRVANGRLEYIEPDHSNKIHYLTLDFNAKTEARIKSLIEVVWKKIQTLDFPDTSAHQPTLTGIRSFEDSLLGDG